MSLQWVRYHLYSSLFNKRDTFHSGYSTFFIEQTYIKKNRAVKQQVLTASEWDRELMEEYDGLDIKMKYYIGNTLGGRAASLV